MYISTFFNFDMSLPLRPTLMKELPSHRIRLYVDANAMPLRAPDTMSGSPSPWKEFARIPKQIKESVLRLDASPRLSDEFMTVTLLVYCMDPR